MEGGEWRLKVNMGSLHKSSSVSLSQSLLQSVAFLRIKVVVLHSKRMLGEEAYKLPMPFSKSTLTRKV